MRTRKQSPRRIVIIDDHPLVREGLAMQISLQHDLLLAGQASSIAQGLKLINELKPDLAIVDISLGDGHGLDLVRAVHSSEPSMGVLVYSMHDEAFYTEAALQAGAAGYLSKSASREQTMTAIRAALDAPRAAITAKRAAKHTPTSSLTARERQIFHLIGDGLSTRAVAERLNLSIHTVDTHREHIKTKLKLKNSAELVRAAMQRILEERNIG